MLTGSTDQFQFQSTLPLSSTRDTSGWWDSYVFPQDWIIKILLAGETPNISLLTWISNRNICLHKEKRWMWLFIAKKNIKQVILIKNRIIDFQLRWSRMSALLLELDRTVHFLSFLLAPHREVAKALPVMMLATKKLFVSVDAFVGPRLFATTLADKHMATVLPNCVLVRHSQGLKSLVTYFTLVNPPSIVCFVPPDWSHPATTWIPSQICPQHLQVQVPADKHPFSCASESHSGQTLILQTGQVGEWQVIWCLGSHQIFHNVRYLCISTM